MPIDIRPKDLKIVKKILREHLPKGSRVWVYGSRAKGTARQFSDLDLAFDANQKKLDFSTYCSVKNDFEYSMLPYKVDFSDWNGLGDEFKQIIADTRIELNYEEDEMPRKRVKVAVSGAAGQIGYALIFRIASGQMFGADTDVELQLLELEAALPSLNGVAMELDDCAFPLLKKVTCTSDLSTAMKDINWALLVGAVPRKAGMERGDLLGINGKVFTAQGKAINDNAADDVRIFVVGNPCNTNCLIAMHNAPDVPRDRFYAMSMLDENRARAALAKKANVDVASVTNMAIWGNHSSTQFPDFYNARIDDLTVLNVIHDEEWLKNTFVPQIQQRGAEVIKARGASSAASAANAVVDGVAGLVNDTPRGDVVSTCVYSNGEYGIDQGLIFSFPCRVQQGKLSIVEGFMHNDFAKQKIAITLDELRKERDTVKSLGLIPA